MTCIVGMVAPDRSVFLAGDRAAVSDGHYFATVREAKVFRSGPFVIGFTSSFRMGQLIQHRLQVPAPPEDGSKLPGFLATDFADALRAVLRDGGWLRKNCEREESGQFLVGVAGQLFTADDDLNFHSRIDGFDAVGSGVSVALGALHATRPEICGANMSVVSRLLTAIEAAERFTASVRGPVDIVELPFARADEAELRQ